MKAAVTGVATSLLLLCVAESVRAVPIHFVTVQQLLARADTVIMGRVVSVSHLGDASIETPAGTVHGRRQSALVLVDAVLKGATESQSVVVDFEVPDVFVGYRAATQGEYRIFFLSRQMQHYCFANPNYPSIPAVPGRAVGSGRTAERVLEAQADVIRARDVESGLKREAISVIRQFGAKPQGAAAALRSALADDDQAVRLEAAAALIAFGDLTALSLAQSALLQSGDAALQDALSGLRVAIRDDLEILPATLPVLSRLLSDGDVQTRQAVSRALRRAHSPLVAALLEQSLDDPDTEVAFNGARGFAALAGDDERAVSLQLFAANREEYVNHWKQWLKGRTPRIR